MVHLPAPTGVRVRVCVCVPAQPWRYHKSKTMGGKNGSRHPRRGGRVAGDACRACVVGGASIRRAWRYAGGECTAHACVRVYVQAFLMCAVSKAERLSYPHTYTNTLPRRRGTAAMVLSHGGAHHHTISLRAIASFSIGLPSPPLPSVPAYAEHCSSAPLLHPAPYLPHPHTQGNSNTRKARACLCCRSPSPSLVHPVVAAYPCVRTQPTAQGSRTGTTAPSSRPLSLFVHPYCVCLSNSHKCAVLVRPTAAPAVYSLSRTASVCAALDLSLTIDLPSSPSLTPQPPGLSARLAQCSAAAAAVSSFLHRPPPLFERKDGAGPSSATPHPVEVLTRCLRPSAP